MQYNPEVHPPIFADNKRKNVFRDKIRWLREGWAMPGMAKELLRLSGQWVMRGHEVDRQRVMRERLGHFGTGLVASLARYNCQMQYGSAMTFHNLKILVVHTVDPVSMEVRDMNWPSAAELANRVFDGQADRVWLGRSERKGQITTEQWVCFYDEFWLPVTVPHMDLVAGSQLWAIHPKNRQETQ
jgi:hypothetical protein